MNDMALLIEAAQPTARITKLRHETLNTQRYVSMEQAKLITQAWKKHAHESVMLRRAYGFRESALSLSLQIAEGELIVGNRSYEPVAGVVFPEGGIHWLEREIDDLGSRAQDRFLVSPEDRAYFFEELVPFWRDKTLEDHICVALDPQISQLEVVGKLNQKDHAQGHICPDTGMWLLKGPANLLNEARERLAKADEHNHDYYLASCIVLEAACKFIDRYADLAEKLAKTGESEWHRKDCPKIVANCRNISRRPARTFYEALQSMWFLFVLLQLESNASSFSPGRADQYLYPFLQRDIENGVLTVESALELVAATFIKFNQIIYLRNTNGAAFFAGFPIGFNIAVGGINEDGSDSTNLLSYIFLRAQEHVRMRQPNLSARLHRDSSEYFLKRVAEVISVGTGMPQVFNDESVIPALMKAGYSQSEAMNYSIVGCVELSTHGNSLGFSDAGMFNIIKVLELTLNDGICMLTGKQLGLPLGTLVDFKSYKDLERAFASQLDYFWDRMEEGLGVVERYHRECMPSPFLSSVIHDCLKTGTDVTAGGARYNTSGIQLIQVANLADCLAALKLLVFEQRLVDAGELLKNLREDYPDEKMRLVMLNRAPKFGNDIEWVDEIAQKWIKHFKSLLDRRKNFRGGSYTMGLYTVSAHVPMGMNVAATPDGRKSGEPLADGGMSAVYGRDQNGPTALLRSVSRVGSQDAANGTLLNMKFSPQMFQDKQNLKKFSDLLRGFTKLEIHHAQFNVVNKNDLLAARKNPEKYRDLLVRVAGYTANYVDLSERLQDEIISRTEYGG